MEETYAVGLSHTVLAVCHPADKVRGLGYVLFDVSECYVRGAGGSDVEP